MRNRRPASFSHQSNAQWWAPATNWDWSWWVRESDVVENEMQERALSRERRGKGNRTGVETVSHTIADAHTNTQPTICDNRKHLHEMCVWPWIFICICARRVKHNLALPFAQVQILRGEAQTSFLACLSFSAPSLNVDVFPASLQTKAIGLA